MRAEKNLRFPVEIGFIDTVINEILFSGNSGGSIGK